LRRVAVRLLAAVDRAIAASDEVKKARTEFVRLVRSEEGDK
jgi:hypothetical protein